MALMDPKRGGGGGAFPAPFSVDALQACVAQGFEPATAQLIQSHSQFSRIRNSVAFNSVAFTIQSQLVRSHSIQFSRAGIRTSGAPGATAEAAVGLCGAAAATHHAARLVEAGLCPPLLRLGGSAPEAVVPACREKRICLVFAQRFQCLSRACLASKVARKKKGRVFVLPHRLRLSMSLLRSSPSCFGSRTRRPRNSMACQPAGPRRLDVLNFSCLSMFVTSLSW
eukprot:COSAG06_NODE_3654_length_5064_cov_29.948640_5_plen_225_part_00